MSEPTAPVLPTLPPANPLGKWTQLLTVSATLVLLLVLLWALVQLARLIPHTLLLFALGTLIAYALDPLVEGLGRPPFVRGDPPRALNRRLRVAVVFTVLLALLGVGVWWLGGRLGHEVSLLQRDFPNYQTRAFAFTDSLDQNLADRGIRSHITETLRHPPDEVKASAARLGQEALPFVRHALTGIAESIIVLLIALYLLLFGSEMRERFNGLLPAHTLQYVEPWQTDVNRILGGFVRGQAIIALIMGASTAAVCFLIGIHVWLLIGLFVTVAALIPVFGPYIGAAPAIIAALVSPTHFPNPIFAAIVVLALFIAINEVGSKVLYPKLVGAALGLHEVLVLGVLFAGLEVGGIVGTLFAAPFTALVIVTIVHLYRFWQDLPDDLLSRVAREESKAAQKKPTV